MRLVLFIFTLVSIFLYQEVGLPQGEIVVDIASTNVEYDLGLIKADEVVEVKIFFRNKLDEELILKNILSDCECLEANSDSIKVPRNGVFAIPIKINTSGYSGETNFMLYLITESKKYNLIKIVIYAFVDKKNNF